MTTLNANETEKTDHENYWDKVRAMSSQEKWAIAMKMTQDYRDSIVQQVLEEQPGLQEHALKIAVARRIYHDCPKTQELLDQVEIKLKIIAESNDPNIIF